MRVSTKLFGLLLPQFIIKESFAYQVTPDKRNAYKEAIERAIQQKVQRPPITVVDDVTYSTSIPPRNKPAALPLSEIIPTTSSIPPARNAKRRKKWGTDDDPAEYWFHNQIHNFGNIGFAGAMHAALAPLATKVIDVLSYRGIDVRKMAANELANIVDTSGARVLDLCCGVGMSTRALQEAFRDAEVAIGVDTSPEMTAMARAVARHFSATDRVLSSFRKKVSHLVAKWRKKTRMMQNTSRKSDVTTACGTKFARGNAERTKFPDESFDVITVFFAFHEAPLLGRYRILREVRRLLRHGGAFALIDISPDYMPNASMQTGEPYFFDYKESINKQMSSIAGFDCLQEYKEIVPGHVGMWVLSRNRKKSGRGSD